MEILMFTLLFMKKNQMKRLIGNSKKLIDIEKKKEEFTFVDLFQKSCINFVLFLISCILVDSINSIGQSYFLNFLIGSKCKVTTKTRKLSSNK